MGEQPSAIGQSNRAQAVPPRGSPVPSPPFSGEKGRPAASATTSRPTTSELTPEGGAEAVHYQGPSLGRFPSTPTTSYSFIALKQLVYHKKRIAVLIIKSATSSTFSNVFGSTVR